MKFSSALYIKLFVLVLLFVLVFFRYASSQSGYPSEEWDAASHIGIVNHILSGNFFPEWNKPNASEHAITGWLPLYHGIIGAHILTAIFVLLGLSIPLSMLIVSDLALLCIFLGFFLVSKKSALYTGLIFLLILLPSFALITYGGFFSLAVGSGFTFLGICLLESKKFERFAYALLLFSFFCYPDSAIWIVGLLAYIFFKVRHEKHRNKIIAYVLFLFALTLMATFIARGLLAGGIRWPLSYFFSLLLILAYLNFSSRTNQSEKVLSFANSYVLTALIALGIPMLLFLNLDVDYYPRKYTYWSSLMIGLVLVTEKLPKWIFFVIACVLSVGAWEYKKEFAQGLKNLSLGQGLFSSNYESEIQHLRSFKACEYWFHINDYLPKEPTENVKNIVKDIAFYSYFNMYDLYEGTIFSPFTLENIEHYYISRFLYETASTKANPDQYVKKLLSLSRKGICFAVDLNRQFIFENSNLRKLGETENFALYLNDQGNSRQ